MNKRNPKVDGVLRRETKWREEFETLRTIALNCGLNEELKWFQPCYTLQKKNVVLIHGFKEFCALMFFKGALLKDPRRILGRPGQHQATRQIRFKSVVHLVQFVDQQDTSLFALQRAQKRPGTEKLCNSVRRDSQSTLTDLALSSTQSL